MSGSVAPYAVSGAVALLATVYLLVALIFPERF